MKTPGIRLPQMLVNPDSVGVGTVGNHRFLCDRFLLADITDPGAGLPLHRVPTIDGCYAFKRNGRTVRLEDHDPSQFGLDKTWMAHTTAVPGPLVTWTDLRVALATDDDLRVVGRGGNRLVSAFAHTVEILTGRGFDLHVSTVEEGPRRSPLLVVCDPKREGAPVALLQAQDAGPLARRISNLADLIAGAL